MLDEWLYGTPDDLRALDSYWENVYYSKIDNHEKFDVYMTFFQSFTRVAYKNLSLSSGCRFTPIWKTKEGNYYNRNDKLEGILTLFDAKVATNDIKREFLTAEKRFKLKNFMKMFNTNMTAPVFFCVSIERPTC